MSRALAHRPVADRGRDQAATRADRGIEPTRLARGRVRPTRRVGIQLLLGVLLYGAGANVAAGWVIALSGIVIGVVPWAAVSAWRTASRIDVRRTVPARAVAGSPVTVTVEVSAPTASSVVVRDELTGAVGATGDPRSGATVTGEAVLPRGLITSGRVVVTATDLFGLFRVEAAGDVGLVGRRAGEVVEVLPPVPTIRTGVVSGVGSTEEDGRLLRRGAGPEIIGVREHTRGDPLRAVHWRSTARRGELVVREFADPGRPRLRVEVAPTEWEAEALDVAAAAACAIATAASAAGQPVEIAADGTVLGWGRVARRYLAALPPHAGAPPRPLTASDPGGEVLVRLAPDGPAVDVEIADHRTTHPIGRLGTGADVGAWLDEHLPRGRS